MQNDIFKQSYYPNILGQSYPPTSISENVLTTASYSSGTSSVNVGPANIFSWAHTVPTYMPWAPKHPNALVPTSNLASSTITTANKPSVVRFTAPQPCTSQTATDWELLYNLGNTCNGSSHTTNQHLKRRSDEEEEEWRPTKQYISEEKMAAKLGKLSISADNADDAPLLDTSSIPAIPSTSRNPVFFDCESDSNESIEDRVKPKGTINFSDDLKKILQPDSLMVKSLVKEIKRPNMALVLWQPPGHGIRDKIWENAPATATTTQQTSSVSSSLTNSRSIFPPLRGSSSGSDSPFVFVEAMNENNNNSTTVPNLNVITNERILAPNLAPNATFPSLDMDDDEMEL